MMISFIDIVKAKERISPFIRNTPIECSKELSERFNCEVVFKLENLQVSGSFKPRGGFNRLIQGLDDNPQTRFITCSSGGLGHGIAYTANKLGAEVFINVLAGADPGRVKAVSQYTDNIRYFNSAAESKANANAFVENQENIVLISGDDAGLIEGAGTIALEIIEQYPDVDIVLLPVGSGGLITGIAIVLKTINPLIKVIGVQAENAALLAAWHKAKEQIEVTIGNTVAVGLGIQVEKNVSTWPYIQKYVDEFVLVAENEIQQAMLWMLRTHKHHVEPAAAVPIAALPKLDDLDNRKIVLLITARNISG